MSGRRPQLGRATDRALPRIVAGVRRASDPALALALVQAGGDLSLATARERHTAHVLALAGSKRRAAELLRVHVRTLQRRHQ